MSLHMKSAARAPPLLEASVACMSQRRAFAHGPGGMIYFEVNECFQEAGAKFFRALILPIALMFAAACFSTGATA
jgi:hypothetical protein